MNISTEYNTMLNKKGNSMKFDLDYIEKLVNLVSDSQLTELALEDGDKTILLKKEKELVTTQAVSLATPAAAAPAAAPVAKAPSENPTEETKKEETGTPILSPMVGTFYSAPSPGAKPFAQVGDVVSKGQVVCIIEAMKLMNEIESEVSGKITKILVEDGKPVEYGQVLMYVE